MRDQHGRDWPHDGSGQHRVYSGRDIYGWAYAKCLCGWVSPNKGERAAPTVHATMRPTIRGNPL